jgi:predicted RNase H-like nuclease
VVKPLGPGFKRGGPGRTDGRTVQPGSPGVCSIVGAVKVAGADVWKGRWVFVVLNDGLFDRAFLSPSIESAVDEVADAAVIGIDMPIGLPEPGRRRPADVQARKYVGPRWQSVFMAPSVELLMAPSHAQANDLAKAKGWEGISAQTYALRTMILQVGPVADRDTRVHEVHPEVSFVRANDEAPLRWSKASWNGQAIRRRILQDHRIIIPDELRDAGVAGVADLLDSAIVAWSAARVAAGHGEPLPEGGARIGAIWR